MNLELLILEGPQAGRRLPIGTGATTFGRSTNAEISFPWDNFISGTHLSIQADPVGVLVTDLHSTNGTFLNGQRINKAVAGVGDEIKIGGMTMRVVTAHKSAEAPAPLAPFPVAASAPDPAAATTIPLPPMDIPAPPPGPASLSGATKIIQAINLPVPPPVASAPPAKPTDPVAALLKILGAANAPLFCMLNAGESATLPIILGFAGIELGTHSLLEGYGSAQLPNWAPFLLPLDQDSDLLRTLVKDGWGKGWCCFFTSPASFEELRAHFSKFLMVQVNKGGEVYFRFFDPRVLRGFLPVANSNERSMFFGPVTEWFLETEDPALLLRAHNTPEGLIANTVPVQ